MLAISMHELHFIPILPDREKKEGIYFICVLFLF